MFMILEFFKFIVYILMFQLFCCLSKIKSYINQSSFAET